MLKSFRVRVIVILAALTMAIWSYATDGLKLGLDLQGGMHLVLEIDDPDGTMTPEIIEDRIEGAVHVLRTRIDAFGVQEPLIQKSGSDRIIVELAGLDDPERAKAIINQQAFLEWKLVLSTVDFDQSLERLDRAIVVALGVDSLRSLGRATEAAPDASSLQDLLFNSPDSAEVDSLSVADPAEEPEIADAADPADSAATDAEADFRPFTGILLRSTQTSQGRDPGTYRVDAGDVQSAMDFMDLPEFERAMPRGVSLQWGLDSVPVAGRFYRELYILEEDPFLTGEQLVDASATRDQQNFNEPIVLFQLNRRGGRVFENVTTEHQYDRIAIVLDGEVVSAPTVESRIGARGQITMGQAEFSEAADLALVLRAGALPAQLRIMEERRVGPSLGQDSIDQGQIAGLVGVILVLAIMIAYYRVAGFLAVGALVIYLTLVIGGLSAMDATLTLPGIAGLILSIGMAVDANVLIFERIREELERRRAPRTAVDDGFSNAISAIVDANITTLITGLILFQFGTQSVKGFAVTLCIGIVASFFTALYVTRTLFLMYLSGKRGSDPISI
ncbi:MAG: protein translocase subunit SecD [Gemmatimonadetes bacterium]|nr:protein translocase subunit SecD [Gemmatimonadota bacterium]